MDFQSKNKHKKLFGKLLWWTKKREENKIRGKKRRELNSLNIYQQWTGSSIVRTVHMIQLQQNCNEYELMDTNNCRNHYRHNRIQCKWTWNLERNRTQNTSDERPKPGSMRANNNKNNKKNFYAVSLLSNTITFNWYFFVCGTYLLVYWILYYEFFVLCTEITLSMVEPWIKAVKMFRSIGLKHAFGWAE